MDNNHFQYLLNCAYFFLKFRYRTKKEITNYLFKKAKKRKINEEIIDQVINCLIDEKLIDDDKFIEWYVEQRNRSKPKSIFVLKRELLRLGIEKSLIDEYFNNVNIDELSLAKKALERKIRSWQNLDEPIRFKKAINFLLRRGFTYETAKTTYSTMTVFIQVELSK